MTLRKMDRDKDGRVSLADWKVMYRIIFFKKNRKSVFAYFSWKLRSLRLWPQPGGLVFAAASMPHRPTAGHKNQTLSDPATHSQPITCFSRTAHACIGFPSTNTVSVFQNDVSKSSCARENAYSGFTHPFSRVSIAKEYFQGERHLQLFFCN